MRKLNIFTHSLLLLTTPSFLLYPQNAPSPVTFQVQKINEEGIQKKLMPTFSYDEIMYFIEELESGELEKKCTPEELEKVTHFLTFLAKEGQLPEIAEDAFSLDEDIEELLEGEYNLLDYTFSLKNPGEYRILTTVSHNCGEVILCKGWIKKKWERTKKFVKKHKKEVVIGAAVVVAVTAVVVSVALP
ncbi:MAG: hypothetical protein HYZ47_00640 [Simkania negevensis]|nr:hypothetical protein [Simkania negevensis]